MIKEGKVRVTNISDGMTYFDHDLGPGEYFGERSLLTGEPRAANIRAVSNVVLMALDRLSFDALLGPLKDVLHQNMILRVLNSQKFFENVDYNTKTKLAKTFVLEMFLAGLYMFIYFFISSSVYLYIYSFI
jgi:CRP-like cAMP-binding protein